VWDINGYQWLSSTKFKCHYPWANRKTRPTRLKGDEWEKQKQRTKQKQDESKNTREKERNKERERGGKGEIKKVEKERRGRIYLRRKLPRSDSRQLVTEMGIRFVIKYCSRFS
jgi:hypothetical protein